MITVKIDMGGVDRMLDDLARNQLPFATAKALTTMANEARAEIVKDLPTKFILRTQWWRPGGQFGMNVKPAKKTDWPACIAEIYTRAQWMFLHEEGGIKQPLSGHNLALPTQNVRRTKRDLISKANRPSGSLMAKAFKQTVGKESFLVKVTKKQRNLMYLLKPQAKIRKSFGFEATVKELVERRWQSVMSQALDDAIKTAK